MEIQILQDDETASVLKPYAKNVLVVLGVLVATAICVVGMEMLSDNERVTGPALSILWCLGLASWSLRAVRSHQSKFGIATMLFIVTFMAIGFANRFVAMIIICMAMVFDLGVKQNHQTGIAYIWRTIQVIAGIIGIVHACRIIYHVQLN